MGEFILFQAIEDGECIVNTKNVLRAMKWEDSGGIFRHTIVVEPDNYFELTCEEYERVKAILTDR